MSKMSPFFRPISLISLMTIQYSLGCWKRICLTFESLRCWCQWCHSPPVKPRCLQVTSRSAWVQFLEFVHTDLHLPFTSTCKWFVEN